jgi:hypothetical protein
MLDYIESLTGNSFVYYQSHCLACLSRRVLRRQMPKAIAGDVKNIAKQRS